MDIKNKMIQINIYENNDEIKLQEFTKYMTKELCKLIYQTK